MKLYGDLGKTAKKLLTDDYLTDVKVKIASKSDAGTNYTAESVQNTKAGDLVGELSVKGKLFDQMVNTKFHTSGKVNTEVTLEKLGVAGLKLILNGTSGTAGSPNAASAKVEFINKHVATATLVDLLAGPVITSSLTTGHGGLTVGAEAQFKVSESKLSKYDFAASYADSASSEVTVSLLNVASLIKTSYSHSVSPTLSVAGEVSYNLKDQTKLLTMGMKYMLDPLTSLKSKLSTDGAMSVAFVQQIRPLTTLTLSSTLNVKELDKGQKFGLCIAYEA